MAVQCLSECFKLPKLVGFHLGHRLLKINRIGVSGTEEWGFRKLESQTVYCVVPSAQK